MNNSQVGDMVVCINENVLNPYYKNLTTIYPKLNNIYTIREILIDIDGLVCYRLEELPDQSLVMYDVVWEAVCFRPVKKTSIEVFEKLIESIPTDILEEIEKERVDFG